MYAHANTGERANESGPPSTSRRRVEFGVQQAPFRPRRPAGQHDLAVLDPVLAKEALEVRELDVGVALGRGRHVVREVGIRIGETDPTPR